ncbi:MAG: BMP family ABC transporter substrate-binding protein [Pseudobacteriovorax sp.]|nr:BMP family ABC transporter substrate-binding protein [Pseudobacteriovorax sp.]
MEWRHDQYEITEIKSMTKPRDERDKDSVKKGAAMVLRFVFLAGLVSSLVACGGSSSGGAAGSDLKVALVTDIGKIDDGTFNQSAYEAGVRGSEQYGLLFDYKESAEEASYATEIDFFVEEGYDMIVTVGFRMADITKEKAAEHTDVKFAIVDVAYDEYTENLTGLTFTEDEAGYMAGALAAKVTTTKSAGVIGGIAIPPVKRFVNGFVNGLLATCSDCTPQCVFVNSFTSAETGVAQAQSMITGNNVDVIFGAGGATGSGGVLQATNDGIYGIGVDTDEFFTTYKGGAETSSTRLLSSAIKKIDEAVFQEITSLVEGGFESGTKVFNAANGGVGLSAYHSDAVTSEIQTELATILTGLSDGTVATGVDSLGDNTANSSISCGSVEVD